VCVCVRVRVCARVCMWSIKCKEIFDYLRDCLLFKEELCFMVLAVVPCNWLIVLLKCLLFDYLIQTDVIETNIQMYERGRIHSQDYKIKRLRYLIANHFMETYEIVKLPESDEVVGKSKLVSLSDCEMQLSCSRVVNKHYT
jgi:hypothetical protein